MIQFNSSLTYSQHITFFGTKEQLLNIFDTTILKDKEDVFSFGFFNIQTLSIQKTENPKIIAIAWDYSDKTNIKLSFELNTFKPFDFDTLGFIEQHFEFTKMEAYQLNLRINSIEGLILLPNKSSCVITKQIPDLPVDTTINSKNYKQIYNELFQKTITQIRESDKDINLFI